jgi:hypothetical protein
MNTEELDPLLKSSFCKKVDIAVSRQAPLIFLTRVLGDSGEAKLKYILLKVLSSVNREDLMELFYTSAKELIANSTKAAIKRILFEENNVSQTDESRYDEIMGQFKENLTDKKFPFYKGKMKEKGLVVSIKFNYNENHIVMSITNNFPLLPKEEERVRQKFHNAQKYDNLFQFYMDHGDNTEGAGMGITLVEIMLAQSGYDRHLFTIYNDKHKNETTARLEVPLQTDFTPMRHRFQEKLDQGLSREEVLRELGLS